MNRNEYLKNLEIKNRRLLLKIYEREIKKLKIKIYEATGKGNDTVYLQKLHDEVEQEIKVFKQALKGYSVKSATDSYKGGAKLALLGVSANEVVNKFEFGKVNREAVRVLAQTTYKPLSKMAQHIGRATLEYMKRENFQNTQTVLKALNKTFGRKFAESEFLRQAGIEGVADVVVGSVSWQKAAREIRDKIISDADYNVPYYKKNGDLQRWVQAKDYAKMVSRTTTANIAREGAKDSILDTFDGEFDLVEIIGHSVFPNSPCIPYEGNILSLEGIVKGYTTVAEAEANGLFHPNCIHSFGVTDAVMEIYRKDEYEVTRVNEDKEEKPEEEPKEETAEPVTEVEEKPKEEEKYQTFEKGEEVNKFFYESKEYQEWAKNLTQDEREAIQEYTGDLYSVVNDNLRGFYDTDDKVVKDAIIKLSDSIDKFELKNNIQVYRGVDANALDNFMRENKINNYVDAVGKIYNDKAFMSTSSIKDLEDFKEKDIQFIINVPKGKGRGAYINDLSLKKDVEYEFVLQKDSKLKITGVKPNEYTNQTFIYADLET